MKFPFNVVHVSGNVLFAARGGKIHSFSLEDGSHFSTWKHPDVDRVDAAVKAISEPRDQDSYRRGRRWEWTPSQETKN
ncbi:hypothetical protein LB505_009040 [Fusarium chuoi]|nr:hypothetical protein LB505_009040 [Fusarium chuoi]